MRILSHDVLAHVLPSYDANSDDAFAPVSARTRRLK